MSYDKFAFPSTSDLMDASGMTLKEYYIGQILCGMNGALTQASDWPKGENIKHMVRSAIAQADAVLELLNE